MYWVMKISPTDPILQFAGEWYCTYSTVHGTELTTGNKHLTSKYGLRLICNIGIIRKQLVSQTPDQI